MIQNDIKSIPNHVHSRTYSVSMVYASFRCQQEVNPALTNVARLTVTYAPDKLLYDFGSLSTYLRSFEAECMSLETCANRILDDFLDHLKPVWVRVLIEQQRAQGIEIRIEAQHSSQ